MTTEEIQSAAPLDLRGIAETIAAECGDKGAIVISLGAKGIRIVGAGDLTPVEFRDALYTAIQYSYSLEQSRAR